MALEPIAEIIRTGLDRSDFTDSLKFDCGADGVISLADGKVSMEDSPAACTLTMSAENLDKLVRGKLNPMTAVMMGKIRVGGDPAVAMRLGKLLKA
ncbi:SCP2 sterol-binding domain-containing protein [Tropicimonas aquimaris]|uniref:SCP2 sterol-binding domain-containing protein n=1 Tax=Tropicimonas aquimaris TaxID=914152 RepID=A0ABW3IVL0_9RHOB